MNKKLLMLASLMSLSFVTLIQASTPHAYRSGGGAPSTPDASRVYADRFIPEVLPYQLVGIEGTLDGSFGTHGSLSLSSELVASQAKAVKVLIDGSVIVLLDNGTNSAVVKYTATGVVHTTGFGSSGIVALDSLSGSQTMIVDSDGRILVAGASDAGGNPWIRRITPAGIIDPLFALIDGDNWSFIGAIAEQSSGRLIFVGQDKGTGYGKVTGYTSTGVIDTNFGTAGTVLFDGVPGHPLSASALYTIAIASDDSMFIGYKNGSAYLTKLNANGALVTAFNAGGVHPGILPNTIGSGAVPADQIRIALASDNNICIAMQQQATNNIWLQKFDGTTGGIVGSFATARIIDGSDILNITDLLALSNGSFVVIGYNVTDTKMRVTQVTSAGIVDTADFNAAGTIPGSNQFAIGLGNTTSVLRAGAVSPDGRLYVAGHQENSGTTTPYLSRIFDELYVSSVAQYPSTREQGDLDLNFGTNSSETYRGINYLFNGKYGATLQQQTNAVIELASGKVLVGMSGKLNTSNNSNMMLTRLNADGTLDTSFNSTGKLALPKVYTDEYLNAILEDKDGNILVAGYGFDGATNYVILRKVTSAGVPVWTAPALVGTNNQGLGIAIQSSQRILLFNQYGATGGEISAHNPSTGALDVTFNAAGNISGRIISADFGLTRMGPIFAYAVDMQDNIIIGYRNSSSHGMDLAYIFADGSHLISEFGTSGILSDLFSGPVVAANVRLALDNDDRIVVVAGVGSSYKVARIYLENGLADLTFGTSGFFNFSVSTAAMIKQLTTLNNNKIVITGYDAAADNAMILARVTADGILDTTFNPQGVTQGILPIQVGNIVNNYYARVAAGLVVQAASGNMVVVGNEQQTSSESIPMIAHIFGQSGTTQVKQSPVISAGVAGTLDTTFGNNNGAEDLTSLVDAGSVKTVYAYRSTSANQGQILVGIDTASNTVKIARINEYDLSLDAGFGTAGITTLTTLSGLSGLKHISLDVNNKILVGGTFNGAGWAKRLNVDGTVDVAFLNLPNLVMINAIYQQKSGRYIVAGRDNNGKGVLVAFQDLTGSDTYLDVDTTFSPLGVTPGWFTLGTSGLYNLAINNDDSIVVAYADTTVKVARVTSNGSGLVTTFGTSGILNTGITPKNLNDETRVAIDHTGKVVVATSVGVGGTSVSVGRYSANGVIDAGFNGGAVKNITGLGAVGVTLADMIVTHETGSNDKIILLGSNTAGANGFMFVARLGTDGLLDSVFNKVPSGLDVAGIVTFTVDTSFIMYRGSLYIDGTIYAGGAGLGNKPLLMAVFGDDYIGQNEEQPWEVAAGIIDTTLDTVGGTGALNLITDLPSVGLTGYAGRRIHIYDDGSMLVAFDNGADTAKVVKYKADRSLDTTFNSGGTPGYVTVAHAQNVYDIYVADGLNDDGSIWIAGTTDAGFLMTHKISAAGVDLGCAVSDDQTTGNCWTIKKSSNSRLLAATTNIADNHSVIVAYKPDASARDLSFGNDGNGAYDIGISNWWLDSMSIDSSDRLYYAYPTGFPGTVIVDRLKVDGTALDSWSAFGTAISATNARYARTMLDEENNRLVIAVQDGNGIDNSILVRRYNATTGADDGGLVTITISGKHIIIADLFIDENQNIYIIGTNETDGNILVVRINSSMVLDSTYGVGGIADVAPGANMNLVWGGALHPDRRVYVVGRNDTPIPSMARVFGNQYTLQETQAIFKALPGTPDLTLDPDAGTPDAGIVLPGLLDYTAYAIHENADGSSYIAFGDDVNMQIGKFNADAVQVTSGFGTAGLTDSILMATVSSLIVDAAGNLVIAGTNAGLQKVVRFTSAGILDVTFTSALSPATGYMIRQQKSGRYLVAGYKGSAGSVNAYRNNGLADDTTFGPQGLAGYYSTGVNRAVADMVVDGNDNIYIVYRDPADSFQVYVEKLTPNGAGKDSAFNSGAKVATGIYSSIAGPKLAINSAGNILVGGSTSLGIQTRLYDQTTGVALSAIQTLTSANNPVLIQMIGVGAKFVSSAYTLTSPAMLTILQTSTGILDTAFNAAGTTPGIASLDPEAAVQMNAISVQADGKFVMVGRQTSPSINPVLMRVYGNPYVTEDASFPGRAIAGTLDTTLSPTLGDFNVDSVFGSLNLTGYTVRKMYTYTNNNLLFVADNGTNSVVFRVHKDFTLDTTFNTTGVVTIVGKAAVRGLYVDENNNIFVTGGTPSWLRAFNNDGSTLTGFTPPTSNIVGGSYAVGLQSLDRIVVSGLSTYGVLYGYTSTTGALDTEFGNGTAGIFTTNVANPIADISIDSLDRIAFVYADGSGNSVLGRAFADGSGYDGLGGPTQITSVTGNQLKVLNDNGGNLIVAAATTTGFTLRRYNTNGANNPGTPVTIAAGSAGTSVLGAIYTTSDNKTVLIGYETVSNKIYVARLTTAFILDPTFNPNGLVPGVLSTTVGAMTIAACGTIYNDNRILIIGSSAGGAHAHMTRVFGDDYVTAVKQSDMLGLLGALDNSYGTGGANVLTSLLGTSIPYSVRTLADGSVYLGVQDSVTAITKIAKLNGLGSQVNAFGGGTGFVTLGSGFKNVRDMKFDHAGKLLAVGGVSSATWALRFNPTTGAIINTFATPSMKTAIGVLEQTNDRIVVAGSDASDNGLITGFFPDGSVLDETFGAGGDGYFRDATNIPAPITSFAVDSLDRIFVGYTKASRAAVARVRANGTAIDADYDDYVGFASIGLVPDVFGGTNISGNVYVAVDSSDNVIVAAVNAGGTAIVLKKYSSTGTLLYTSTPLASLTLPVLQSIMVTNTNEIMVSGNYAAGVFTVQFNANLTADTNFSTAGVATYVIDGINSVHASSLTVDGTFYLAGNDSAVDPILIRAYADRFIGQNNEQPVVANPGDLDVSLNGIGGVNLTDRSAVVDLAEFVGKAVYAYPNNEKLLVAFDDSSTATKIARLDADGFLDASFGTGGFASVDVPTGVQRIELDQFNNILVIGDAGVVRYSADGTSQTVFAIPVSFTNGSDVAVQKAARVIASGYDSVASQGALLAYQSTGVATDASFGLVSQPFPRNDRYLTGVDAPIDSFVINNDDTMVIAYNAGNNVTLRKLNADGSQRVSAFGTSGTKIVIAGTAVSGKAFLIKDESQKLVIAAKTNVNEITVKRYSVDGNTQDRSVVISSLTAPTITSVQETSTGQILISGYLGAGFAFIARLQASDFSLDGTFGAGGVMTTSVAGILQSNDGTVRADGRIALVGQDGSSNPILLSVIGDPYVGANTVATQFPAAIGVAGRLDRTLDGSGALNLNTALSTGSLNLTGAVAKQFHVYDDGRMLIAFNSGTSTTVVRLNKDQSLDTTFGNGSGIVGVYTAGPGFIKILNAGFVNDMFVDDAAGSNGSMYLVGTYAGSMWYSRITANGAFSGFSASNPLSMVNANQIRKTTNSRLLIAGKTGASGIIEATIPFGGLDLSFGNGTGSYVTGVNTPIVAMELDQFDRMYIAYIDGSGNLAVQRIQSNGGRVDGTFTVAAVSPTTALSQTQIRLILDEENNQIVVAVQDGTSADNIIKVRRFSTVDGSATGSLDTITISGKALNLSDLFIDENQNIYVIGYNPTDNNVLTVRIDGHTSSTTIALDVLYGTGGIANVDAGSNLNVVQAGVINLDNRVYLVGSDNGATPIPSMGRLFGDAYFLEETKANPQGLPGTLDLTLDAATGGILLSSVISFGVALNGYTGRAIFANADGSSYVAFGNGTNVILGKLDCDQQPVTSGFGIAGLAVPVAMAFVNSLAVDSYGRILVAGTNGGSSKVLRYPVDGTAPEVFATIPLVLANKALEQQSGRILVAGRQNSPTSSGAIYAYQNTGLGVDITFGQRIYDGFGALTDAGTLVNQPVDDMVIDQYDNIYLVFVDGTLKLQKIKANGSALDPIFAGGSTVNTGIIATGAAYIGINSDGAILVGASVGANIQTALYDGVSGSLIGSVQTIADGTPVLTQITGAGEDFVASAYQTTGGSPQMLTVLIEGSTGLLDTDFAGGTGIAQVDPLSANQMNGVAVQPDGRFLMLGQKTASSVNYPVLERVYGETPYTTGDAQFPGAAVVGILDITLHPTNGALDLSVLNASLVGFAVKRIYTYVDGKVLLALDNGTDTKLVRMYKDMTLDATFNGAGIRTIAGLAPVTSLYVDQFNNIFVAGSSAGLVSTSWVRALSNAGAAMTFAAPTINLAQGGYAFEQQSLGRSILAGQDGGLACMIGYNNVGGVDTEFGVNGKAILASISAPIVDITIDSLDRIVIAAAVSGSSVIQRFDPTGTIVDATFTVTAPLTGIVGNDIRVIQGSTGNIIIGIATSTGFKLRTYSKVNGSVVATSTNITATGIAHLANIYATSDGKTVLVGYTGSGNVVIARFNSDLTLDGSFNPNGSPAGVLSAHIGLINAIYDGTIYADDRIYVVGGGSDTHPYIARAFGDAYQRDLSQAPVYGVPGTLDLTIGTAANGAFELNTLSGVGTAIPQAILVKADGSMTIAMQTNTLPSVSHEALLVNIKDNLTPDTAGLIDITSGATGVKALSMDFLNRLLVAGSDASTAWVKRYNAASGAAVGTFPSIPSMSSVVGLLTQSQGRAILGGDQSATAGTLVGLAPLSFVAGSPTTTAVFDASFGNTGAGRFTSGFMNSVNSFAIDSKDRIVVGFVATGGSTVTLARIRPNGSGFDTTFNGTGLVTTPITTAAGTKPVRVALDNNGAIVVVSTIISGGIQVARYNEAGTVRDITITYSAGSTLLNSPVITQLLISETHQIIIMGYENVSNGKMFVMRLRGTDGTYDTTFNPAGSVPGILTYVIHADDDIRNLYAGAIAPDGRILGIGYEDQTPAPGRLDRLFGTAGSESLNGIAGGTGYTAIAVQTLSDGSFVVLLDKHSHGTDSYFAKFNSAGVLDITFGDVAGLTRTGYVTLTGLDEFYDFNCSASPTILIDSVGRFILCGSYNSNVDAPWIVRITPAGVIDSTFNWTDIDIWNDWDIISISLQSTGKIIAAGINGSVKAMIARYNTDGSLDTSFGTAGYIINSSLESFESIVIDSSDRIFVVYADGSNNVFVTRFTANGVLDTSWATSGIQAVPYLNGANSDDNGIFMAMDKDNNLIIATQIGNNIKVTAIRASDGTAVPGFVNFTTSGGNTYDIKEMLTTTNGATGKILLIGSNETTNKMRVTRLNSNGTLDTTFNPSLGYNEFSIGSPSDNSLLYGASTFTDGHLYVAGSQLNGGTTTPYVSRLLLESSVTQVHQHP